MINRKYLYLIALARTRHFGKAAAACHVSPSTLSSAIRQLESELGVAVVERGQQFAGLTPEGERVVEYAQRASACAADLKQELASLSDTLTGRLRLGVIPTALTAVAALTSAVCRHHPRIAAELISLSTDEILDRLHRFELDAGVIYVDSVTDNTLDVFPVWCERHVLLTAADGPFAGCRNVSWHDAASTPLCLLTPDMQNRKTIDAVFAEVGASVTPTLETNSILSILAHVGTGHWSSIVPKSVLEQVGTPAEVVAIELAEPTLDWTTGLVVLAREPQPPVVRELIAQAEVVAEVFAKSE